MKQYKITTKNLDYEDHINDCILSPDDPIFEIKNSLVSKEVEMSEYNFENALIGKYWKKIEPIVNWVTEPII